MGVQRKPKANKIPIVTTSEMEVAIAKYFNYRTHIVIPNLSWGFFSHECDLFLIRKSGFGFEVEIKRSKSDMLADFKKYHGHVDRKNRIVQLYYAFPIELLPKVEDLVPEDCGIITVKKYKSVGNEYRAYASMHREAKRRKGAKKLTQTEQLKITRLASMRIWTLKEKLNLSKYKK
jgi:hypothetical protein